MPVVRPLAGIADVAALLPAFRDAPYPVLLDSAARQGDMGRYSYLTADPFLVLRARGGQAELESGGQVVPVSGGALRNLRALLAQHSLPEQPGLPPFQGGAVGFISYDFGRRLERIPSLAQDDLGLPDLCLGFYDWVIAQDHATGDVALIATGFPEGVPDAAQERVGWVLRRLEGTGRDNGATPRPIRSRTSFDSRFPIRGRIRDLRQDERITPPQGTGEFQVGALTSTFTRPTYLDAVRRVKEYLEQGEIYQANLSQRFAASFAGDPWALYERVRAANPAPFAAYLGFPDAAVLSASPELFLRLQDRQVETRPIKGTRPRGVTPEEDRRLAMELEASAKDRAENLMIVDLLRNDLGRVCAIGSVHVPQMFAVESHPTVHHLVSAVTGTLAEGRTPVELLAACFPGGSVTGAPKIRAMQVIEELEPVRRGVYCGAIGYIGFNGNMALNIPIRTMVVKDGRLTFSAGGAIVQDSEPEAEYQETLDKVRGLMRGLGVSWE